MAAEIARQAKSIDKGDLDSCRVANLNFRHAMLAAGRNPTIEDALRSLYAQAHAVCIGIQTD